MVLNNEDMLTVLENLREKTDGNKCGIDEPSKWKQIIQKAPQVLHLLSKQELKMLGGYLVKEMVADFQIQPKVDEESEKGVVNHFVRSPELEDFGIVFSSMIQNIADDVLMLSGKHKVLMKLVIEILNGSGQYKCPPSSLEIGYQVLSSLPLVALSDKDREDISYVCISVLKTFPNLNAKKEEATLNVDLLRNWCLLLATVLDLSHETDSANIFRNIPPNLYFNWLVDGFSLDFNEGMNQAFITLIEKSCFALFIDKDVWLKSEGFEFINQLAQSLKLTKPKNIAEKKKCVILKSFLQHLICHWKKSADEVKFEETLSSVRNTVNQHLHKQSKNLEYDLSVDFLQVVATILNFECQEDAHCESPNPNLEYLLNNILWTLENRQIDKPHLELIESILFQYQHFRVPLNKSMVKQIWNLLLTNVTSKTSTEDMEVEESDADVERRILNICKNPNPSQIQNGIAKITHETFDLGPAVCKIFVRLFEFLDSEDLQRIFQEILEHLLKLYDAKQLLVFLNFWNEFLPMLFETKVKEFLPNTFCAILLSCNQIVEGLKEHSNSEGVRTVIMMVFSTIKSILSYNSILQDSNLAFLCLNICQLVASGMVAPFEFIMPVFKEICDVLFSFITNYENQAKNMLPTVLAINKMLVDVIFMYGYEGSKMDIHQLSQIENCANLMTRLFMNYSKQKESLSKIAMYLIGDYCCRSLRVTLYPKIKKEMIEGVYILMDICDEHRFKQLKRTLPSDVQFLFVKLLQEYQKYYKYQGKF